MTDREKVIKALTIHTTASIGSNCNELGCFYCGDDMCLEHMMSDALKLLEEQEPVEPVIVYNVKTCGVCGATLARVAKFCYMCGREVKWK